MFQSATSRRRFLGNSCGALGALGLCSSAIPGLSASLNGRAKRCVVLWMNGGPSQLETFDPKPGMSTGGPTKSIQTSLTGINIADTLPMISQRMDQLTLLRNITSTEGEHERAQYYLHTGFPMVPAFPRPALGSVMSHELPDGDSPKYVLLGGRGFGPAYCGPQHASFTIENAESAHQLLGQIHRRRDDLEFLRTLGSDFDETNNFPAIERRRSMISRIERMVRTPFREALNLDSEKPQTRQRYGDHEFGRRCLLARRLLERDVPFVEVQLDGWDTHVNNFHEVGRLAAEIDAPWSALIDDLIAGGLWSGTLLLWMGEFGRTPTINGQNGRDHFPVVTPVVLGGGCIRTGQVIGQTNRSGTQIDGTSYRVADIAATMLQLLGIDPQKEFRTSFGSPAKATDEGRIISGLSDVD